MMPNDRAHGAHGPGSAPDAQNEQAAVERLDAVLDAFNNRSSVRSQSQSIARQVSSDLTQHSAAARALGALAGAEPSTAFSARLENELRQRLRAGAARTSAAAPAQPLRRAPALFPRPIPRFAWWAIAASLLLALLTAGALTANAAPGGPLSTLIRTIESAGRQITSGQAGAAQDALQQARQTLARFDNAAGRGDDATALDALQQLASDNRQVARTIAQVGDSGQRASLQSQFTTLQTQEVAGLRTGLGSLGWPARVQVTNALRGLGVATLTVTDARIVGGARGSKSNGQVTFVLSGWGFAPGAALLINGQPMGTVDAIARGTLVGHLTADQAATIQTIQSVGAGNPDGSAATTTNLDRGGRSS